MAQFQCRCASCMDARAYEKRRAEENRQYANAQQIRDALIVDVARERRLGSLMNKPRLLWLGRMIEDLCRVLTEVPGDAQTLEVQSWLAGEDVYDLNRFLPVTIMVPGYVAEFVRELQAEFP